MMYTASIVSFIAIDGCHGLRNHEILVFYYQALFLFAGCHRTCNLNVQFQL